MVASVMTATKSSATPRTFSIGELAKEFDITTRSIRFYEDQGLIAPERQGQTRIYNGRDKVRLKLILRGKRLGFTLAETRRPAVGAVTTPQVICHGAGWPQ